MFWSCCKHSKKCSPLFFFSFFGGGDGGGVCIVQQQMVYGWCNLRTLKRILNLTKFPPCSLPKWGNTPGTAKSQMSIESKTTTCGKITTYVFFFWRGNLIVWLVLLFHVSLNWLAFDFQNTFCTPCTIATGPSRTGRQRNTWQAGRQNHALRVPQHDNGLGDRNARWVVVVVVVVSLCRCLKMLPTYWTLIYFCVLTGFDWRIHKKTGGIDHKRLGQGESGDVVVVLVVLVVLLLQC